MARAKKGKVGVSIVHGEQRFFNAPLAPGATSDQKADWAYEELQYLIPRVDLVDSTVAIDTHVTDGPLWDIQVALQIAKSYTLNGAMVLPADVGRAMSAGIL